MHDNKRHTTVLGSEMAYAEVGSGRPIVMPFTWDGFGELADTFRAWRSAEGEQLVLEQNSFVEGMLPGGVIRQLTEPELTEYRRPFEHAGEARRPTLTWPREVPIDGEPADVDEIVRDYSALMAKRATSPSCS